LALAHCVAVRATTNDLALWYSQPAEKWTEALPIGNGRMGAMVFGGTASERIQFNEDTLWRGKPHDYVRDGAGEQLAEIRRLVFEGQADVAGKRIDDARVGALLAESDLVVAHNAAFDRPFLEPRFPGFAEKPWGCSMADVPWIAEGLPSTKLEWLCERHAHVFYDAHRADIDTIAGIHLLASALPSGRRAMQVLLEGVRRKTVRVWALESPFATKGVLKARGYRWSGGEGGAPKAWWLEVREEDLEAEREWLALHVYRGEGCRAQVQRFGPKLRYSARIGTANLHPLIARPSAGDAGGDGRAP